MKNLRRTSFLVSLAMAAILVTAASAMGQAGYKVLDDSEASNVIPSTFYFAGQSAGTQMRNAAAARIGKDRQVLAGLVDTSGYSSDIQGKYEGFFITDSPVRIGTRLLPTGAYGFGFAKNGRLNILDLGARQIASTVTNEDAKMNRPRPLQMIATREGIRLYKGRRYVVVRPQ